MTNEDFLRQWLQLVWIDHDFKAGEAAFSATTADASVAGELKMQANDYETMVNSLCYNFKPCHFTLNHVLSIGPEISAVLTVHGTRTDTQAKARLNVFIYRKIEAGKFTDSFSSADYIGFFRSMGQLPEDTIPSLLMGGALVEVAN